MATQPSHGRSVRFGLFKVDLQERELYKNSRKIKLQEQPYEILVALLERPGETVTTEELSRRVWPDGTFVDFEHGLYTAVRKIRHALDDSAENPRFVETIPRRGYRFIAPVLMSDGAEASCDIPASRFKAHRRLMAAGLSIGAVGALAVAAWFFRTWLPSLVGTIPGPSDRPGDEDRTVIREIWSGPLTAAYSGEIAPDGKYWSFVDWETGDLAIRDLATGETRRLTQEASLQPPRKFASVSTFSPSGKQLTYSWFEANLHDLRIIGIDGTGKRILCRHKGESIFPVRWSPDGGHIAARRYSGKDRAEIVIVSVADGSCRVLKAREWQHDRRWWPQLAFSPDSQYLTFDIPLTRDSNRCDISLIKTDGSHQQTLIEHPANDRLLGWVPRRDEILFLSNRTGTEDIWVATVVGGRLDGSPKLLKRQVGAIEPKGFSRDGCFYWSLATHHSALQIVPIDPVSGMLQDTTRKTLLGSNLGAEWSPGGEYLACVSLKTRPGGYEARPLVIHDIRAGKSRELVNSLDARAPRWSCDGRHILFQGFERDSDAGSAFYRVTVDSGELTPLVGNLKEGGLSDGWWNSIAEWSYDGTAIYYVNMDRVVMRDLESGRELELYSNPHLSRRLDLSPDGEWLLFGTEESANGVVTLLLMPSSGGAVQELFRLEKQAEIGFTSWTPSGEHILFSIEREGNKGSELWRISLHGREPQNLWQSTSEISGLSVHPDGRQIALSLFTQTMTIWAMENYLPYWE